MRIFPIILFKMLVPSLSDVYVYIYIYTCIYTYMLLAKKRGHYYLFIKHWRRRYICLGASQQLLRRPTLLCQEHFIHRRISCTVDCTK